MNSSAKDLKTGAPAVEVIERIVRAHSNIWEIKIVEYNYVQGSLDDPCRVERCVRAPRVRSRGLASLLDKRKRPDWDVALYSRVRLRNGTLKHIPMMDFKMSYTGCQIQNLKDRWREVIGRPGYLLGTDNSYHWYGTELITHAKWVKFMGRALLCNRSDEQIVDARYVGHRLFEGCGSLRFLGNNKRGTKEPTLLEMW